MVEHKCNKCNKLFSSPSKLERHNDRKKPCNQISEQLKCDICNVKFKCNAEKERHENTKKHINNTINNNGDNNFNVIGNNNFNNIINLTLNTKTFANSNVDIVANLSINLVYGIFDNIIKNRNLTNYAKALQLFKEAVIFILDTLHFNITNSENHNLKILLMFPKIDKLVYEYLILEINPETSDLVWNSISYEQLLEEIFILLHNVNAKNIEKHRGKRREENDVFEHFINYLKANLINDSYDEEIKESIKNSIETELGELYIQFNKKEKKEEREVKLNIYEKIQEYKNYRDTECRLSNGFTPKILNPKI